MKQIQFRKAEHDDLKIIQEIARDTINRCYRIFLGDALVDWFLSSGGSDRELELRLPNCDVLLLDSSIAGFSIYFENIIHLMMVDAFIQNNGFGSRLLAHTEGQLFDQGNQIIRVDTFEGNQQAVSFFKKNNWSVVHRIKDPENGFVRVCFQKNICLS